MKTSFTKITLALSLIAFVGSFSASAAIVWELNPDNKNAPVGSSSYIFTAGGKQITATGYDNVAGPDTPHELFFKSQPEINGAVEHGLGLVGTPSNELQVTLEGFPANYIQLDLRMILQAGFVNGMIEVGSVQAGESFQLFGSNAQGTLGVSLGVFGSAFDDKFIPVPLFGTFQFLSIAAATRDVLPVAFSAEVAPVPELSALWPILALFVLVAGNQLYRRRA